MDLDLGSLRIQQLALARADQGADSVARESDTVAAAEKFEEMFASMLVKELRRGLDEGFFGQGPGAGVFEGWLDRIVGEALVRGKGLGIADAVERSLELTRTNEKESE